jgi:nucleoside-diphosphate-sugar epimerase
LPTMFNEGDSVARRMLERRPVIVAGDGSTPWTLTRSQDFARPFVGLFGKSAALGEDFHITSDNAYAWDDIYETIAAGLGVKATLFMCPLTRWFAIIVSGKAHCWATRLGPPCSTTRRSNKSPAISGP